MMMDEDETESMRQLFARADEQEAKLKASTDYRKSVCADDEIDHAGEKSKMRAPTVAQVNATHSKDWNDWFVKSFATYSANEREWVMQRLKTVIKVMTEESTKVHAAKIERLNNEIGQLRADLTLLQSIVNGDVKQIGKANAA